MSGSGNDDHCSHHGRYVFPAKAIFADLLNAVGYEIEVRVVGDQPRPHIGIPALDDLQDHDGHQGGRADRDE